MKGLGERTERAKDEGAGLLVFCVTARSTALPSGREGERERDLHD